MLRLLPRGTNWTLGIFGIAGYTFEGIYSGIQEHMERTTDNYIVAARVCPRA